MEEILAGVRSQNVDREENGWKLFLLLPRMLLHKPARGGGVPKHKLMGRFNMFNKGQWEALLKAGGVCCTQAAVRRRRTRHRSDNVPGRVARAEALLHLGELSSARQVLEGAQLADVTAVEGSVKEAQRATSSGPARSDQP